MIGLVLLNFVRVVHDYFATSLHGRMATCTTVLDDFSRRLFYVCSFVLSLSFSFIEMCSSTDKESKSQPAQGMRYIQHAHGFRSAVAFPAWKPRLALCIAHAFCENCNAS